jgi:hypothetical protein
LLNGSSVGPEKRVSRRPVVMSAVVLQRLLELAAIDAQIRFQDVPTGRPV